MKYLLAAYISILNDIYFDVLLCECLYWYVCMCILILFQLQFCIVIAVIVIHVFILWRYTVHIKESGRTMQWNSRVHLLWLSMDHFETIFVIIPVMVWPDLVCLVCGYIDLRYSTISWTSTHSDCEYTIINIGYFGHIIIIINLRPPGVLNRKSLALI